MQIDTEVVLRLVRKSSHPNICMVILIKSMSDNVVGLFFLSNLILKMIYKLVKKNTNKYMHSNNNGSNKDFDSCYFEKIINIY